MSQRAPFDNTGAHQPGEKSLFFLMVLDNPFIGYYKNDKDKEPKEPSGGGCFCQSSNSKDEKNKKKNKKKFEGNFSEEGQEETLLKDAALLYKPSLFSDYAPSDFMKVIDIVLRLERRGFDVLPENMVSKTILGVPADDLSG
eukprot:Tbor_TRINITY_DN5165_c0_g1::TRINITY_DN5165_c0_g1_i1::g.26352::m.26352